MNIFKPFWYDVESTFFWGRSANIAAPHLSERRSLSGDGILRFHDIVLPDVGELRATLIEGRNADIFNVMIFPFDSDRNSVFASEIVRFGGAIRAAVIDLQPLTDTARQSLLGNKDFNSLRRIACQFPSGGDLPAWCQDYFTPSALWSRMENLDQLQYLRAAFSTYLRVWLNSIRIETSVEADSDRVAEYKRHHIEHSPGLKFLYKQYGSEWTQDFLWNGMYRGASIRGGEATLISA